MQLKSYCLLLAVLPALSVHAQFEPEAWTHLLVDTNRQSWGDWEEPYSVRYFGMDAKDVTGDGFKDIVAGRYFYRNPGGNMSGEWERTDLGLNVDGMLFVDVDGDEYADVIGQALPNVYWMEAEDMFGRSWTANWIAELPKTEHRNGQGYRVAQVIPGGKPELVFTTLEGVYFIVIPEGDMKAPWKTVKVTSDTMDEGVGVGDVDGDGFVDFIAGVELKEEADYELGFYKNPGDGTGNWERSVISTNVNVPDCIRMADCNGDGRLDVVVSEERRRSSGPTAQLAWFENPGEGGLPWEKHLIYTGYSLNNMDVGDVDNDGDVDVTSNEITGPRRLIVCKNDGQGNYTVHQIDEGKDMHLGARLFDLDNDGDLDIAGPSWYNYQFLHLWRNNTLSNPPAIKWSHMTTMDNLLGFPTANVGWQSSAVVFDIDKDGTDDIVIGGWSTPSMIWYKKVGKKFQRYLIDDRKSHIEAGGVGYDIDGDGDLDILQGGSWNTIEVWWWENPYPNYDPDTPWNRYTIKNYGKKQHHDQMFGDFDGDGEDELVFWNQGAKKLWIAEIPEDPTKMENWKLDEVWSWTGKEKFEGLVKADIDLDGVVDIVGGGYWFKHNSGTDYTANLVDDFALSRCMVGDFIEGGRPEIILSSADYHQPLNLYEWKDGAWVKTTIRDLVANGHTLEPGDINGDGHLDFFNAEFRYRPTDDDFPVRTRVFYGDGKGRFTEQLLSIGVSCHQGKLGDLDGDGDLDLLQKDFRQQKRVDVWFNEGLE